MKRLLLASLLLSVFLAPSGLADAQERRGIALEDFFRLENAGDPAISPDGIPNWVSDYATSAIPRTKESEFYGPPWWEEWLGAAR